MNIHIYTFEITGIAPATAIKCVKSFKVRAIASIHAMPLVTVSRSHCRSHSHSHGHNHGHSYNIKTDTDTALKTA